jgi:fibronectin type 3 domain-containing protein
VTNADAYAVYRSTKATEDFSLQGETKGTVYIDTRVNNGTIYYYSIKTLAAAGPSDFSSIASGFAQIPQVLGIPQNIFLNAENRAVNIIWDPVSGADAYNIYRFDPTKDAFALIGRSRDHGFRDNTITTVGATWFYAVTAIKGTEESAASASASIFISAPRAQETTLTTLSPVTGLQASQGNYADRIELRWQAVKAALQYQVFLFDMKTESFKSLAFTTNPSYTHRNPTDELCYYAVVPIAGDIKGPAKEFFSGYTRANAQRFSAQRPRQQGFADDRYRSRFQKDPQTRIQESARLFQGDQFFTDSNTFFNNFVPKDFFKIDEAAFFAIDPNFFKVPDNFFMN